MCFICQDTGEICIISEEDKRNNRQSTFYPEPCPICNDFSLYELHRIIIEHKKFNKIIKSIRMNQLFLDKIYHLIPLEKISNSYRSHVLKGIPITIDNNIKQWEIEYEK